MILNRVCYRCIRIVNFNRNWCNCQVLVKLVLVKFLRTKNTNFLKRSNGRYQCSQIDISRVFQLFFYLQKIILFPFPCLDNTTIYSYRGSQKTSVTTRLKRGILAHECTGKYLVRLATRMIIIRSTLFPSSCQCKCCPPPPIRHRCFQNFLSKPSHFCNL